jgi:hypothetical protein
MFLYWLLRRRAARPKAPPAAGWEAPPEIMRELLDAANRRARESEDGLEHVRLFLAVAVSQRGGELRVARSELDLAVLQGPPVFCFAEDPGSGDMIVRVRRRTQEKTDDV